MTDCSRLLYLAGLTFLLSLPADARDDVRVAQGKPAGDYWQQRVDFDVAARLLEDTQTIEASARVTYHNHSPATLQRLWFSTVETGFDPESLGNQARTLAPGPGGVTALPQHEVVWDHAKREAPGVFAVTAVTDSSGEPLNFEHTRGKLRIELDRPLATGKSVEVGIEWILKLGNFGRIFERAGYEYYPATDNYQFSVGRWLPRPYVFRPEHGWATEPFMGEGEFAGEFGDFDVRITVPASHIVAATGSLVNPRDVLSSAQLNRLAQARNSAQPEFIVTPEEAKANEESPESGIKTWHFRAAQVRDFAWSSSEKFAWDAAGYAQPGADIDNVLVMSFYPYEAAGLWSRYSTALVRHTLDVYRRFTFDYPYPTLQSVNAYSFPTGIEYPMLGFTGPRPYYDHETGLAQYGRAERDALVELVIHESGHTWFPMIVNSNERLHGWMDEGINTFLNHIAVLEWHDSPGVLFGKPAALLLPRSLNVEPRRSLMTPVDQMPNYFQTIYFKAAGALTLLREDVLGRDVFDRAMSAYAQRWAFKQPGPVDFFRTFEDVSGRQLDWFWNGWFYGTGHYDMGITEVLRFEGGPPPRPPQPPADAGTGAQPATPPPPPEPITLRANREAGIGFQVQEAAELQDYYDSTEPRGTGDAATPPVASPMQTWFDRQSGPAMAAASERYGVRIANVGGLILPLTLRAYYEDESFRDMVIPPEAWRLGSDSIVIPVLDQRKLVRFTLDPEFRHPDSDPANNSYTDEPTASFMFPPRPQADRRGEMGRDGVGVTPDGKLVSVPE